jgi:Putative zinc-finger
MIPYVGCEYAREHLDGFVDGELSVDEQVAVESHLRWCRTCAARVEDLQLIGHSIRLGSMAPRLVDDETRTVNDLHSSVLIRVRTEEELSLGARFREMFTDMRLLWPALGATAAVTICLAGSLSVLQLASLERPESLATMLDTLANPGAERNPLMPGNNARVDRLFDKFVDSDRAGGISMPRASDDQALFEGIPEQDAMYAVAAVVSREGRIANYELLKSERTGQRTEKERSVHANDVEMVLDAVRQSRFAPAQTPLGRTVAVNMVWLIYMTTVETPAVHTAIRVPAVVAPASRVPPVESIEEPPLKRSDRIQTSTTA